MKDKVQEQADSASACAMAVAEMQYGAFSKNHLDRDQALSNKNGSHRETRYLPATFLRLLKLFCRQFESRASLLFWVYFLAILWLPHELFRATIQPNTKTTVITSSVWMFGQQWYSALDLRVSEDEGLTQGWVAHGLDLGFFLWQTESGKSSV